MGQLIVTNAPTSFTTIWAVIKLWLSPHTLDKISILGANQYHAVLLNLVLRGKLPALLGGTCMCDGGCMLSNAGPWMYDRHAECCALWLSGELTTSGMPRPSFSDEENISYDPSRYRSIRRGILERLQRKSDRSTSGVSREFSRRTAQTYLSTTSAYSGTHSGDSRAPSAMPPSMPPQRDVNTEWVPGSGFRIVEETISNPPSLSTTINSPLSGLPRRTSAWDSNDALRQAVDIHPGERWLAWTRSWTSNPPSTGEDRFTAAPSRRAPQKKDVEVLLRSPPQLTSSPLQSTLTFSPLPGGPTRPAASRARHSQASAVAKPVPNATRETSNASSIVQGDGHGTAAMRYAARHTALTRVEEILAHSYSSRDLAPPKSPTAFGAVPASLEDIAWAVGIEQRMAAATPADRDRA
jgi:CRAL/TRIO domain